MTLNQLFNEYQDLMFDFQSPKEQINKRNRYRNHIAPGLGNMLIDNIKLKDCQSLCNNLIKVKELSPKTAKNVLTVLRTLFTYALRNDYIEKNPAQYVRYPQYDNKYNLTLTEDDIKNLINEIKDTDNRVHRAIFITALHGRRLQEVLSLQWYQVDFLTKTYSIPAQKNKSKKDDTHSMTHFLYETILEMEQLNEKHFGRLKNEDYVFINPRTATRYKDISKPFKYLKERAGIDMRFHDFRHIIGTIAVTNNIPIEHISQALGHSDILVTQKYITKNSQISQKVVDKVLSALS